MDARCWENWRPAATCEAPDEKRCSSLALHISNSNYHNISYHIMSQIRLSLR